MDIKSGTIVKFKEPLPEDGDYPTPYRVIEDRDNRVLVEPVWHEARVYGGIVPQFVYLKADLVLSFAEHTDVDVPAFVDFSQWEDSSWHNDITASIEKVINNQYAIRVWIYDTKSPEAENYDKEHPFVVCYIDQNEGWMSVGTECASEEECIKAIEDYTVNFETKIKTVEWL